MGELSGLAPTCAFFWQVQDFESPRYSYKLDNNFRYVTSLLFIDGGVADAAVLRAHLRPGVVALTLDGLLPVAKQILAALRGRNKVARIDIIAHGQPGRVCFAAGDWTAASVADQAADFAAIGAALGGSGELNLWSCRAGAGAAGAAFVAALEQAAGIEVAASARLIGAAALGGDWDLGGAVPPVSEAGQAAFAGVLASLTVAAGGQNVTLTLNFTQLGVVNGATYNIYAVNSAGTPVLLASVTAETFLANYEVTVALAAGTYQIGTTGATTPGDVYVTTAGGSSSANGANLLNTSLTATASGAAPGTALAAGTTGSLPIVANISDIVIQYNNLTPGATYFIMFDPTNPESVG